jgi:RNA-directed DNA polymerase
MRNILSELWQRLTNPPDHLHALRYRSEWQDYYRLTNQIGWKCLPPFYGGDLRAIARVLLGILERDSLSPDYHYRHFTRPKEDGTLRHLVEPDPQLKRIQQQIRKRYLRRAPVHSAALGFRRKKSTADHAWAHAGAHTIITTDIIDFFPSTAAYRVENWWKAQFEDNADAARLYMLLTTYRGSLPQGAPTSPDLSNVLNYEMDAALERRVKASGGVYTRYCDDLAFSWRGLRDAPSDFEGAVRGTLADFGYDMHRWQVWEAHDEPQLTGIILARNGGVKLPDTIQETMRGLARSREPYDAARLEGYRAYEQMVKRRASRGTFT